VRDGLPNFASTRDDWKGAPRPHKGIDIYVDAMAVQAVAKGRVVGVGDGSLAGGWVKIDHGGGVETVYVHVSGIRVSAGDTVLKGQPIAIVDGPSGNAVEAQLHFELRLDGESVDFIPFIFELAPDGLKRAITRNNERLEVLRLEARAEQAERELRRSDEHLRLAQAREEVGAGTRLETMQAQVARGRAEVNLVLAQNAARVSKLRLVQALGIQMTADRIDLVSEFEIFQPTTDMQALMADALQRHPQLIAARADRNAANSTVKVAKAAYFPTLALQASWSGFTREVTDEDRLVQQNISSAQNRADDLILVCDQFADLYNATSTPPPPPYNNCSQFELTDADIAEIEQDTRAINGVYPFSFSNEPVTLSAFFSLPLFRGFDRQLQVEQAIARRNDMDYQVRGLELQVRADVTEAVHNLETAYQTVRLQEENTQTAREELRLAQERYQLGAGTFLELLDSQTLAAQAEVDQIESVFAFHQSLASLEAAVGRPLQLAPRQ